MLYLRVIVKVDMKYWIIKLFAFSSMIVSYFIGAMVWIFSLYLTYTYWKLAGVFFGLFMLGIGVLPIALLTSPFKGDWINFKILFFSTVLIFLIRIGIIMSLKVFGDQKV